MKVFRFASPLVISVLSIGGCSSLSYDSAFDETVDFSSYETFGWMPTPDDATSYSTIFSQRVERSIASELTARGMVFSESDPDLYVAYHANVERRVTGATIDNWGYGWGGWGHGGTVNYNEYEEGTLFVDLVDAVEKEVVWRGTVRGAVSGSEPSQERIDEVIGKLLTSFPPEG
jgi:hypothetical protein